MSEKKVIKKILFGDLHLKVVDPLGIVMEDGLTTRVHKKIECLNEVIDYAIKNDVDEIIDLGDTFNNINPPDKLRTIYARTILRALDHGIRWSRILGNHETDGKEGTGTDIDVLGKDLIDVYSSIAKHPEIYNLVMIPEVGKEEVIKAIEEDTEDDILVIGHFGVSGVKYVSGMRAEEGLTEIPEVLFKDRKFPTFLGHIHKRQYLCAKNVVYIGALCRNDFGDIGINPGFCVLNLELEKDEFGYKCSKVLGYEFVSVSDIGLRYLEVREREEEKSELSFNEGDIVKLVYKGSYAWFSEQDVNAFREFLLGMGVAKIMLRFDPVSKVDENITVDLERIDFIELIKDKAKKDKKGASVGIGYYNKALEVIV